MTRPKNVHQAIILAAGKGERLNPLTALRPKVMLPVANKPTLQYVVEALEAVDITDVVIVVGYHREQIQDYFGSGERFRVNIDYAVQEHQLGTGHALLRAKSLMEDKFLVLPGDNIVDQLAIQRLVTTDNNAVLVTKAAGNEYGVVTVEKGRVQGMMDNGQDDGIRWVNTSAYQLDKSILNYLADELDLPAAIDRMIQDGKLVEATVNQGIWLDAAFPQDLLQLNAAALSHIQPATEGLIEQGVTIHGSIYLGKNSVIRANSYIVGPVAIGDGCDIGPSVSIFPSTSIGNGVVIESFSQIRNSILGNSVQIGSHSHLCDSIIADGCTTGPSFVAAVSQPIMRMTKEQASPQLGAIVAEDTQIGSNVSIRPGVSIGHGSRISDMKTLRDDVPDLSIVVQA